jgi:nitrite reductase/ring-hydroxylating ferredoxin subunit
MTVDIRAGFVSDFAEGQRVLLEVNGREVFVFERAGRYYAFENVCPHMGGPVGEGILMGKVEAVLGPNKELIRERFSTTEIHLVCPWHGWEYDIETGECAALRRYRLRRYEAVQRGDEVYVVA